MTWSHLPHFKITFEILWSNQNLWHILVHICCSFWILYRQYHIRNYKMCWVMITNVLVNCSEFSQQWKMENILNLSLSSYLNSLLGFIQGYPIYDKYTDLNLGWQCSWKILIIHDVDRFTSQWAQDNCADKYWSPCHCGRDDYLSLVVYHSSFSYWEFIFDVSQIGSSAVIWVLGMCSSLC